MCTYLKRRNKRPDLNFDVIFALIFFFFWLGLVFFPELFNKASHIGRDSEGRGRNKFLSSFLCTFVVTLSGAQHCLVEAVALVAPFFFLETTTPGHILAL